MELVSYISVHISKLIYAEYFGFCIIEQFVKDLVKALVTETSSDVIDTHKSASENYIPKTQNL